MTTNSEAAHLPNLVTRVLAPSMPKVLALLVLFVLVFQYRPLHLYLPVTWPDGWGYLLPALDWVHQNQLHTIYGRTFVYPMFLGLVLGATKSFVAIGLIQKLLQVASCFLVLAVMLSAAHARDSRLKALALWVFLLAFAWLFLTAPPLLIDLHHLQPEALAPIFMSAGLFTAWLTVHRLMRMENYLPPLFCLALINVLAYFHRPKFAFAMAAPIFLLALCRLAHTNKFLKPALFYVLFVAVVFLPAQLFQGYLSRNDSGAVTFLPMVLFTWHAPGIKPLLERDVHADKPPFDRQLTAEVNDMLAREFEADKARKIWYPSLGFNPDGIFYLSGGFPSVKSFNRLTPRQKRDFLMHYYYQYVLCQPLHYLNKIKGQLALYYNPNPNIYATYAYSDQDDTQVMLASQQGFEKNDAYKYDLLPGYFATMRAKNEAKAFVVFQPPRYMALVFGWLSLLYFPVMIVTALLWLVRVVSGRLGAGGKALGDNLLAPLSLFCFASAFLIDLAVSVIHSLEVGRYFQYHFTLNLAAELFGLLAVVLFIIDLISLAVKRENGDAGGGPPKGTRLDPTP